MNEDTILGSREVSEDEIQGLDARSPAPGRLAQLASALRKPFAGQARSANARYDARFDGPPQGGDRFGVRSTRDGRFGVAPPQGDRFGDEASFLDYMQGLLGIGSAMTSEYQAMGKISAEAAEALKSRFMEGAASIQLRRSKL